MTVSADDADKYGNENRILFWLKLDKWHLHETALLFVDVDPDSFDKKFTNLITFREYTFDVYADLESKYNDLRRILFDSDIEQDTPKNWIERALAKKIAIPWLEFAIHKGFYKPEAKLAKAEKPLFDKASATYPPELDIAIQAWQAVTNNLGKGKAPKAQIIAWLDANAKLSGIAKKRIATVANWKKTGGATPTD